MSGASILLATMSAFVGTWHGTSTCVDLELTPACKNEVVVYEVARTDKPDTAHLMAYKVVDGKRLLMGESDFTFDEKSACWRSEFRNERVHLVQCLTVRGTGMTGTLIDVPTGKNVRDMKLQRETKGDGS